MEIVMRLNESDAQVAAAAVQMLEREVANRLEEYPEASAFPEGMPEEARRALDEHDRITHLVKKLQTSVGWDLCAWEIELVRDSLNRYQAVLGDHSDTRLIADENSCIIESDEQREVELRHTDELIRKLPRAS